MNKLRGTINVVAVKAPGFGDRRKENLGDLAALTGGNVISDELGRRLDSAELEDLGRARRVVIAKDETTIVEGHGTREDIEGRIGQIKGALETTTSDWDREKLQERLGKLAGSVAVIKVGAATEVELKERKHRVEDALSATRAAIEEGIVPGGGVALIAAQAALDDTDLEGDERTGVTILRRALEEPLRRIAINAGQDGSRHRPGSQDAGRRPGLRRRPGRVRRHAAARHHRPAQGDALRPRERGQHRRHGPDHELPGHGHPGARRRRRPELLARA